MKDTAILKQITAEEEEVYKSYIDRPYVDIPEQVLRSLAESPVPEKDILLFENINELLNPGYLPVEIGYCSLSDGSIFSAMHTTMPGVTGEMIDWWYWWNPMHPLRYKMIHPRDHFSISVDVDIEEYRKREGSYQSRLWNTVTYPVEDVGAGHDVIRMHFVRPDEFGLDMEKFARSNIETAICARVGSVQKRIKQHGYMCHLVRKIKEGVEVRTRCWIGKKIILDRFSEGSSVTKIINHKQIKKKLVPGNVGYAYAIHCSLELNKLASILPELFARFG